MTEDLSKLGLSDLFDELIPPSVPEDISMVPQTMGWIWLAIALILIVGFFLNRWRKYRNLNAYRREAVKALKLSGDDPLALATVLRQTALAAFPRKDVAGLIGESWLVFLDKTAGKPLFSGTVAGQSLTHAAYQTSTETTDLAIRAKEWVKTHKATQSHNGEEK